MVLKMERTRFLFPAPYTDCAPYLTRVVFLTTMMTTIKIRVKKLLMPRGRKRERRFAFKQKLFF